MLKTKVVTKGGKSLARLMKKAKAARGIKAVSVGFFGGQYPGKDVTDVQVAAANEYGTRTKEDGGGIPERPFFRAILPSARKAVRRMVRDGVDPRTLTVHEALARRIGGTVAGQVKDSIDTRTVPGNAPSTVAKKGENDPLKDTGFLRQAATYKVEK